MKKYKTPQNTVTANIIYALYYTKAPLSLVTLRSITGNADKTLNNYLEPLIKNKIIRSWIDGREKLHVLESDIDVEEYLSENEILIERKTTENVQSYISGEELRR